MPRWRLQDFGDEPAEPVRDLLRTLANGEALSEAAQVLVREAVQGHADRGVLRLLPMLRDHPAAATLPAPIRHGLEPHYRKSAAGFLIRESMMRRILDSLGSADIPVLLLKGFPLACLVYASPAHRPSGDIDFAVPPDRYGDAETCLLALGFQRIEAEGEDSTPMIGLDTHAQGYRHPGARVNVDLHYHIFSGSLWPGADDGFWAAAEPLGAVSLDGALTLAPEHHLVHACLHGYCRSVLQLSIRWMLDAHRLLTSGNRGFRWELVEREARRHRCGPLLGAGLDYLATHLGSPIPAEVIARLAAMPMPSYDRTYFRLSSRRNRETNPWLRLRLMWSSCQRQDNRRFYPPLPFLRTLARRWHCGSLGEVVVGLCKHWREPQWLREKRRDAEAPR